MEKDLMERLPEVFGRQADLEAAELTRQEEHLERKVGELTDVEFLLREP